MNVTLHPMRLPLKHPFTIARGTLRHQETLIVALHSGPATGYGEATCNRYYGHDYASLSASLARLEGILGEGDELPPAELFRRCEEAIPNDRFALSAVDAAAYDLHAKRSGKAVYEILGLQWDGSTRSSYTLGIDSIETMIQKLHEQPDWPIYKIKLGTPHDLDIVRALRAETDAVIRVDANCAWTPEQAVESSRALADLGVEFIEQPLPADAPPEANRFVFDNAALPVIADESCRTEPDVEKCHGAFHGINVKLCKCGGLTPAARMLRRARELGMKTMVGCMVESSVGITAAANLLPLLDYADLDGAVLLAEDPARGAHIVNGRVEVPHSPAGGIAFENGEPASSPSRLPPE